MSSALHDGPVLVQVPGALSLVLLEAAMVEYHHAMQPPETAWGHRGDFAEGGLVELRACHGQLVALGDLIARLGWARPAIGSDETVPVEAGAALLERVLARTVSTALAAADLADLLDPGEFDRFVRTLRALLLLVEQIHAASVITTGREAGR